MPAFRLTRAARQDLIDIGQYTVKTWGPSQAVRYLDLLEQCAHTLANNPSLGRDCGWIRPELLRFEKGRHTFFYRRETGGILVSRILHQSVLPHKDHFEPTDQDN